MTTVAATNRDDRVLAYTRGLSLVIVPFLLVAFALLYLFPGETKRLFAWTIKPTMTPMALGSAYLGGAYSRLSRASSSARLWYSMEIRPRGAVSS